MSRSPRRRRRDRRRLPARARRRRSAARDRSAATMGRPGGRDGTAMQPLPVPTSTARPPARRRQRLDAASTSSVSGAGSARRGDLGVEAVELARAGEIRHRDAIGAAVDQRARADEAGGTASRRWAKARDPSRARAGEHLDVGPGVGGIGPASRTGVRPPRARRAARPRAWLLSYRSDIAVDSRGAAPRFDHEAAVFAPCFERVRRGGPAGPHPKSMTLCVKLASRTTWRPSGVGRLTREPFGISKCAAPHAGGMASQAPDAERCSTRRSARRGRPGVGHRPGAAVD